MEASPTAPFGTLNDTQVVAFQSYFLVLLVLACIAIAYLIYRFTMFIVALRSTYICEEFCEQNCVRK